MNYKQESSGAVSPNPDLLSRIQGAIDRNGGWLGFDQYMQMALYTPGMGYYSASLPKFGAAGDFITAPEMGDLFGNSLATQVAPVLDHIGKGSILEFGAGSGALAATLLNALGTMDVYPEEYMILELSGELRARQQETIRARAPAHYSRVKWLDTLPEDISGVVLANEVLDAMPVKMFELDQDGEVWELGVVVERHQETAFCWEKRQAGEELREAVKALDIKVDGACYRSEIGLQAAAWIQSLDSVLRSGLILLVDYGFRQQEYYHPDRAQGTLMCHYQHRAHDDPFFQPGLQDITAHVDFSAVARAARNAGFEVAGYATQGAFLLSAGLLECIPPDVPLKAQLELSQQVKKLIMPHEMGELFKVMALTRDDTPALTGFAQQDHVDRL